MKGFCGIDIDNDKAFISFASLDKQTLQFLEEIEIPVVSPEKNLIDFLKHNAQMFIQRISEKEIAYSVRVEKVFINLPWGMENKVVIDETIPLKKRKKIAPSDIDFAKRYLQDSALDWDDVCLHHLILYYEVEGNRFVHPPLGVWAKKIKLHSMVLSVKEKLHKEVEDIFDNLDREFGGFIFSGVSCLATSLAQPTTQKPKIIVHVGCEQSFATVYAQGNVEFVNGSGFSTTKIFQEIEKKFLLPFELAKEISYRYLSFKDIPTFKEISVRNGQSYINVSTQTFNSFVRELVAREVNLLLAQIKNKFALKECSISFIGRLNVYDGLYEFLKASVSQEVEPLNIHHIQSSSFGCLRYGISRFLEHDYVRSTSLLQKMTAIYKEYF
jgi:cell division ATPase FtsA